ncbi:nucleotidyltransferase domain-containing protein [Rhizobium sp. NXC14]|uniref:nucleotidyltransferase domain-containing protein n=1 Tax=Rhizobium sp. NXC14 TaxID=1981173 RepID=UPI000A2051E2|nr:nucleotidyltransferase domain-containing protein [Rhizobium sp. NXC14]ARO29063.1 nucleotidyltransferase domain-containing protein [Rhizobium sp. NXC14]
MARPKPESALRFPLSTVFGSEANVRVMRELSLHGGQLSVGDLISRTRISRPPILAALATLASLRIVAEVGTGYARLFSLNRDSPFFAPVQALFVAEERRFADILAAVKECASLFGDKVVAAWIFGSAARREDNASSDLDVALIADTPDIQTIQNGSIDFLAAKGKELSFSPSVNTLSITDLKRLRQSDDPLWKAFLNEGLVVLGPRPESIRM